MANEVDPKNEGKYGAEAKHILGKDEQPTQKEADAAADAQRVQPGAAGKKK